MIKIELLRLPTIEPGVVSETHIFVQPGTADGGGVCVKPAGNGRQMKVHTDKGSYALWHMLPNSTGKESLNIYVGKCGRYMVEFHHEDGVFDSYLLYKKL